MMIENKHTKYEILLKQGENLIDFELDNSTNICSLLSLLKYELDLFWVGIYVVDGDLLKLGLFQGMTACTKIGIGKGVCGRAAETGKVQIVKDVEKFPGYIACHSETKSEIVLPGIENGKVKFVLDVDSTKADNFDETDELYLSKFCELVIKLV
jgi:L-methionine (R)-S-oxide reductase